MTNRLCAMCAGTCKQDGTAHIVRCPMFRKRVTKREFERLVDDLDVMEERADEIRRRARDLVRSVTAAERDGDMADTTGNGGESV